MTARSVPGGPAADRDYPSAAAYLPATRTCRRPPDPAGYRLPPAPTVVRRRSDQDVELGAARLPAIPASRLSACFTDQPDAARKLVMRHRVCRRWGPVRQVPWCRSSARRFWTGVPGRAAGLGRPPRRPKVSGTAGEARRRAPATHEHRSIYSVHRRPVQAVCMPYREPTRATPCADSAG